MAITIQLKGKIDSILAQLKPGVDQVLLEDDTFKDLFLFIGRKPAVVVEVVDLEKSIYIGKN